MSNENVREENILNDHIDIERYYQEKEQFEELDKIWAFDQKIQKFIMPGWILLMIVGSFFAIIRPYFIEKIPVKFFEIGGVVLIIAFFSLLVIAAPYVCLLKLYEYKKRIIFFFVLLLPLVIFIFKNITFNNYSPITHEDYIEAMEIIEVENEAELAEKVEDYNITNVSTGKQYSTTFRGRNYIVDVCYNEDFEIINQNFKFFEIFTLFKLTVIFIFVIGAPLTIFYVFNVIVDLLLEKIKAVK